jgi:hypothetical protein
MTKVVFRYDKKADEVLAVFPELGSRANYCVTCYAHTGQHFEASHPHIIETTQPATIEQYGELLAELEAVGYDDLRVVKRCRHIYK